MRARIIWGVVAPIAWGLACVIASSRAYAAPTAEAPHPRGTYIVIDRDPSSRDTVHKHGGLHILYLNGCHDGGCTITPGEDDSRTNRSSIIQGPQRLPPWSYGEESWNQMVDCVRALYARFDVIVTDIDPGPEVDHFEAMVAGSPFDIGMAKGVGGVSPYDCSVIDNAVTFTFAQAIGDSPRIICEVVAQESAHAYGLDHENLCADPMTYQVGCGDKTFQDIDAPCGELYDRECQCGGETQNSVQQILSVFGPAVPATPPAVSIRSPDDRAQVRPGFAITVDATDDSAIAAVEAFVNGDSIGVRREPPYEFRSPADLMSTVATVEVRARDDRYSVSTATIHVRVGEPCSATSDCDATQACIDGRCVPVDVEGGLGWECTADAQCLSRICVEELGVCTELCDPAAAECPDSFDCVRVAGGGGACLRSEGGASGCGCVVGRRAPRPVASIAWLAALGVVVVTMRRRRR